MAGKVTVNRAPVLTLWAAVVAERLGYDRDTALSLGKAVAGLTAQRKGQRLGIYHAREHAADEAAGPEPEWVELVGRQVPTGETPDGIRAIIRGRPATPESVRRYLEQKFGDDLAAVRSAMEKLAASLEPDELNRRANRFYEKFRPRIPSGTRGWGASGVLDLAAIEALGKPDEPTLF